MPQLKTNSTLDSQQVQQKHEFDMCRTKIATIILRIRRLRRQHMPKTQQTISTFDSQQVQQQHEFYICRTKIATSILRIRRL
jgi:hypothetical protein